MSWTNGTWADVAIGDTVLGGDGYPWSVTDGLLDTFDVDGSTRTIEVTMKRDGAGERTGRGVPTAKPVKYQAGEPRGVAISCNDCQYAGKPSCELHAPEPAPAVTEAAYPPRVIEAGGPGHYAATQAQILYDAILSADWGTVRQIADDPYTAGDDVDTARGALAGAMVPPAAPKVAPYVEYDDAERAAASALKGAGLTMTVIERVMTLDGLMDHLEQTHGEPMADFLKSGKLTRIELRSKYADLHFELHAHDQERGQKWAPRGRTPHVHPVMDRPMEDATPKSLRRR